MTSDQRKARLNQLRAMNLGDLRDCATEMYRMLSEDNAELDRLRARVAALTEALRNIKLAALTEACMEYPAKVAERFGSIATMARTALAAADAEGAHATAKCPECGGKKQVPAFNTADGRPDGFLPCASCNGTGDAKPDPCSVAEIKRRIAAEDRTMKLPLNQQRIGAHAKPKEASDG